MIGDLVRFIDVSRFEIIISGRIKQYLSLVGEHLSLDNINNAVADASKAMELEICEFCLHPVEGELRHHWFIGVNDKVDAAQLISEIDKMLCQLNDDYAAVRKYTLLEPRITLVPTKAFYAYLESMGKLGGQNKIPRVMNQEQVEKWKNFLKNAQLD